MTPLELMEALVSWIMASEHREWFMFGMLVGMFMMFSILTGYWLAEETIRKIMGRK